MVIFVNEEHKTLLFVPNKCGTHYCTHVGLTKLQIHPRDVNRYRTVGIIRNPIDRFFSSATQTLINNTGRPGKTGDIWEDRFRDVYSQWKGALEIPDNHHEWIEGTHHTIVTTFKNFVTDLLPIIGKFPDGDPHFWSQHHDWTDLKINEPEIIVPINNMSSWLSENLGLPCDPPIAQSTHKVLLDQNKIIDKDTEDILKDFYKIDNNIWLATTVGKVVADTLT